MARCCHWRRQLWRLVRLLGLLICALLLRQYRHLHGATTSTTHPAGQPSPAWAAVEAHFTESLVPLVELEVD